LRLTFDPMFLAWTAGPIVVCLGSLKILQRVRKRQPRRPPFTQRLERTPGGTLLARIDELSEDITLQAVSLVTLPFVAYAGYVSHLYVSGREADPVGLGLLASACLAVEGYFLLSMFKMIELRRGLRLGYIGELTVGQGLNRMMLEGYRVYHDFPAEGFNIDHIVVGPKGVFAIETKTRSKPVTRNRQADATVTYDGRMLHFPTGSSHEIIDQAKRQSKWLARWLSQAVGEPLTVRAVVALPGWFVKRTSPEGPPVVNPKQFTSLFEHIPPRPMSPETMARVVHQLDQRCIDVPAESLLDG
jgi:hypothetical protein